MSVFAETFTGMIKKGEGVKPVWYIGTVADSATEVSIGGAYRAIRHNNLQVRIL